MTLYILRTRRENTRGDKQCVMDSVGALACYPGFFLSRLSSPVEIMDVDWNPCIHPSPADGRSRGALGDNIGNSAARPVSMRSCGRDKWDVAGPSGPREPLVPPGRQRRPEAVAVSSLCYPFFRSSASHRAYVRSIETASE